MVSRGNRGQIWPIPFHQGQERIQWFFDSGQECTMLCPKTVPRDDVDQGLILPFELGLDGLNKRLMDGIVIIQASGDDVAIFIFCPFLDGLDDLMIE